MEVTQVEHEKVMYHLSFIEPFVAEADVTFTWTSTGDQLNVTWSYDADADIKSKVMGAFISMNEMLGAEYEKGLATLKNTVAATAKVRAEQEAKEVTSTLSALEEVPAEGNSK